MEKGHKKLQSLFAQFWWKKSKDSPGSSSNDSSSSSKSKTKSSSGRKFDDIKALCHVLVPMESLGRHRCVTQKLNDVSREVSRNFYISTDHDICHHKVSLRVAPDYLTMTPTNDSEDEEKEEEKRFPMQDVIGFESYERQFFLFAVCLRGSEEVSIYALRTPLTINAGELRAAFVKYATCERHHIPPPTPNVSPRDSGDDGDSDSDRSCLVGCQRFSLLSLE